MEAGGGVVAHAWQLQAAVLLFQAMEREVTALPLSSSVSFFFLFFHCQVFPFLYSLLSCLFLLKPSHVSNSSSLPSLSLSLSLSRRLSFSFRLISFSSLSFFSSSSFLVLRAVFIGQRGARASLSPPYRCAWGVAPSCPATTPS